MKTHHFKQARTGGFSLMELLIVLLVIVILIALIVPSSNFISNAEMEQGVELVTSQILLARQTAIKQNQPVEVRFYYYDDPIAPGDEKEFRAMQYLSHAIDQDTGDSVATPISKVERLPPNIILLNDPKYSTLVTAPELASSTPTEIPPDLENVAYFSFFFFPNGSADLKDDDAGAWFLTIVEESNLNAANGGLPSNYVVIQLEPFTGAIRRLEPRAG